MFSEDDEATFLARNDPKQQSERAKPPPPPKTKNMAADETVAG